MLQTYTIRLSEPQRMALFTVLSDARANPRLAPLFADGFPLDLWPEMLEAMPAQEAETPGCDHGFCL